MTEEQKEFIKIFSGLDRAYGQTESRAKNQSGKLEAKSWIVKEQLTEQKWLDHLKGKEPSLGIIPIRDDNTCTWGAIDIDSYDGFDHLKLIKKIIEKKLPLLVCKSKSGGAHVFLFLQKPAKAVDMQMKLTEISAWIGYGESEIFPKQIELNPKGTGNFLNLPYNHPDYPTRYALDDEGNALDTLSQFIEHYKQKVIPTLDAIVIEKPAAKNDDWKGAPPCLITLVSQGVEESKRNECLFQVGIYLRQRFPDELEDKLDYYNLTYFKPPLPSKEVQTLLGQVSDRKNYFFRCKLPVFKVVCEELRCKNVKFGIGRNSTASIHSLKKYVSDEPLFEITHNGKVMIMDGDTLGEHPRYRKWCIKHIDESPLTEKADVWADKIQSLFDDPSYEKIYQPGEITAKGQYLDQLKIFLENNGGAKDRQDVLQGMVYEHENYLFFKPQPFRDFLKMKRFTKMSETHQYKIFTEFGGNTAKLRVNNKAEHVWKVPSSIVDAEFKLRDTDFTEEDPY